MEANSLSETKKRIIIADDSELNCEMLSDILGDLYEYVYVYDGDGLLNMLSNGESADMILLDMNMPKMSGMDVLKVMNSHRWTEEIPVVIISAEDDSAIIQNAYELGATEYIVRPFQAFFVKHRVASTLTLYSQRKQLARYAEKQVFEREKMNKVLINIFGSLVELRNNESGEHTLHVQTITKKLLKRLVHITDKYKFSREDIVMISTVSALHDIGKALIPSEILNKPGKLSPDEWEIMKSHTVQGDEFLQKIKANDSERFMMFAREICRSHHERYDGKGYPDGLSGDDIPISAQVVSIADVYDALTSDRCYKKAYSHEKALEMICNGECGSFNPLLIQCLMDISDDLLLNLKVNTGKETDKESEYDISIRERIPTDEIHVDERVETLLEYETEKKEFFAERCAGIQFEYDAERRKVVYLTRYNEKGEKVLLSSDVTRLLCDSDLEKLSDIVGNMTRRNNTATVNMLIPIGEDTRWHALSVKSIWGKDGGKYKLLVGQFTDIHDKIIKNSAKVVINGNPVDNESILAMREVFDIVRLVDPRNNEILKIDENGDVTRTGQKCYHLWGRREPCQNCPAFSSLENKNWVSKFEMKDKSAYSITAKYAKCGDQECAIEVVCCLDDDMKLDDKVVGYTAFDTSILQNYYRDTVTNTYSRAYLDTVLPGLENVQAVAVIDVDDFKSINDKYGHMVGDSVLRHVAKQIIKCKEKRDTLIRYGGDEFVLVFFDITEKEFFEKLAYIKRSVRESVFEKLPDATIGISIGGAYGVSPISKAIDIADKEMYKDKFSIKEVK